MSVVRTVMVIVIVVMAYFTLNGSNLYLKLF